MTRRKELSESRIRLEKVRLQGSETKFEASFDASLSRYLRSGTLRVQYDAPVEDVDPGIAAIPFVTTVLTVAWATGCTIELPVLDQRFLNSMESVRQVMKSWYPGLPFSGGIKSDTVSQTGKTATNREGLLYSGGLDSTASLIRCLDVKPVPILVIGTPDLPSSQIDFHRMFLDEVRPFVERLGLNLHVAQSTMLEMVNLDALNSDFGELLGGYWWESVSHGLMLLGACAPLTFTEGIGTLRIAASRTGQFEEPWGSNPEVDEKVAWGATSVVHDSHDISRQQKIDSLIAPFLRKEVSVLPLRVCGSTKSKERLARKTLNCGRCEKCTRTIVGLLAVGVDPRTCSFDMRYFSAQRLRQGLEGGSVKLPKSVWDLWVDIQASLRKREKGLDADSMYGSGPFLEWLRGYDLERNLYRPSWVSRTFGNSVPRLSARRRSVELIQDFKLVTAPVSPEQDRVQSDASDTV